MPLEKVKGVHISETFHRHVVASGDDYSQDDDRVRTICKATHTKNVVKAYKALQESKEIV